MLTKRPSSLFCKRRRSNPPRYHSCCPIRAALRASAFQLNAVPDNGGRPFPPTCRQAGFSGQLEGGDFPGGARCLAPYGSSLQNPRRLLIPRHSLLDTMFLPSYTARRRLSSGNKSERRRWRIQRGFVGAAVEILASDSEHKEFRVTARGNKSKRPQCGIQK